MPLKQSSLTPTQRRFQSRNLPRWEQVGKGLIIFAIAMGIVCRVANLGEKPLWMDEGYTLLRASGYTAKEAQDFVKEGQIVRAGDFLRYQQPAAAKGIRGTIEGLALEEPQHPPLYFVLTRLWEEVFGSSMASARLLAAIFGILGIPAMFWLGWELFRDRQVAALATAFYSLSPILVQMAQSARQYSLWLTLMLIASALLLQLLRQPKVLTGCLYGLMLAIGFYTHLLTGWVIIGHGLYVLLDEVILKRARHLTVALKYWALATLFAAGCAFPWLILVWQNRNIARDTTNWLRQPITWSELGQAWNISLAKGFVALHFNYAQILPYIGFLLALLIIYAFYYNFTRASASIWGMISGLAGTAFLPFLTADLRWGGRRTVNDRYFLLCYVCIYFVVAFLLIAKLQESRWRMVWRGITLALLSLSLISATTGAFATNWWGWSEFERKIPLLVQQTDNPLVVVRAPVFDRFRFAHEYAPDVDLLLLDKNQKFIRPRDHENIFFYGPDPVLINQALAQGLQLKSVFKFTDPSTNFKLVVYQTQKKSGNISK